MDRLEIYKDVKGYEDYYQVSDMGNVRSKDRYVNNSRGGNKRLIKGKVLAQTPYCGYNTICFCVNGVIKQKIGKVHRMVAEAFIENVDNKRCVNHKDGNKLNNDVFNLEWVTYSENTIHAINTGLKSCDGKIVLDFITGIYYKSANEAAIAKGLVYSTLRNYLNGRQENKTSLRYV